MKMKMIHALIAASWVLPVLVMGAKGALLGSEEQALARKRGQDEQAMMESTRRKRDIQVWLDRESSEAKISAAVRRLHIPVRKNQHAPEGGGRGTTRSVAGLSRTGNEVR